MFSAGDPTIFVNRQPLPTGIPPEHRRWLRRNLGPYAIYSIWMIFVPFWSTAGRQPYLCPPGLPYAVKARPRPVSCFVCVVRPAPAQMWPITVSTLDTMSGCHAKKIMRQQGILLEALSTDVMTGQISQPSADVWLGTSQFPILKKVERSV